MKLAICNELFEDWPMEKTCDVIAELGYSGIELAPFTLGDTPTSVGVDKRKAIVETCARFDISIIGLHWLLAKTTGLHLTTDDSSTRKRTTQYLMDLIDLCGDLHGNIMVFGSPLQRTIGSISRAVANQRAREVLIPLEPLLVEKGVHLALEPLGPEETDYWNTADETMQFIDNLGMANVGLHLDVKAMSTEQKPFADIIESSRKHLIHFHLNDPNRLGPGMGDVDYCEVIPTLQKINYDGWLSVEVFDFSPGPTTIARQSAEYMARWLD
ncbi:MAG: sugar phosphate isomerase/epimerase family protein [Pirellulaceae bacterium]